MGTLVARLRRRLSPDWSSDRSGRLTFAKCRRTRASAIGEAGFPTHTHTLNMTATSSPVSARHAHQWTAGETLAELAARRISAVELLEHYLHRRAALDGALNAVVAVDPDAALETARDIDARRAAGAALPPLAGLTMTIKDAFEVTGMTATCGIPALAHHRPTRDADAVAALRAAGAVIYGKTNCPLGAADHQTY